MLNKTLCALVLCVLLAACGAEGPRVLPLTRHFDKSPTGFEFSYPEDWEYVIPVQGVLLAGFRESVEQGEPGPTFTVQRALPVSIHGSVSGALNAFLEFGPLSTPERWRVVTEEHDGTLEGRPARIIEFEGHDEGGPMLFVRIIAVEADNTFVYQFILSVPLEMRERYLPTLEAILETVKILE